MSIEDVTDERIAASMRDAQKLLVKLELTPEERRWASERAKHVMHSVTEELLSSEKAFGEIRPVAAAAAIAFALVITNDWVTEVMKLKP